MKHPPVPTAQDTETLELLVDRLTMPEVLNLLTAIATFKAEHIQTDWQDSPLAASWDRAAALLSAVADDVADELS